MKKSFSHTIDFHASLRTVHIERHAAPSNDKASIEQVEDAKLTETERPGDDNNHDVVSLLSDITQQLDDIKLTRDQNLRELQVLAIELAVAVSAHVIKKKVDAEEFGLDQLVSVAIQELVPADQITVSINPLDHANLEKFADGGLSSVQQRIELVEDAEIPRGSCHVEGNEQALITSLETRLNHIRETLLQGIEYARTERRKAGDVAGSLRRFPDRRKTA